jgi:AAA15 family ATPase/GTPase
MIKSIEINHFKSIAKLKVDDFKRINLIVGKNNASKTTILEALFLCIGASNPQLILNINNLRGIRLSKSDDFRFVYYNLEYKNKINLKLEDEKHSREIDIEPSVSTKDVTSIKRNDSTQNDLQSGNFSNIPGDIYDELTINFSLKEFQQKIKHFSSKVSFSNSQGFEIDPVKNYKEKYNGIFLTSKTTLSANITNALENLIIKKNEKKLISYLSKIDKGIVDIKLGSNQLIYFDVGLSRLIPANLIGDGVLKLMNILLAIMEHRVVLIDEIDNGLHFSALKDLWRLIFNVSADYKTQLFVTTHDFETLKCLKEVLEEEEFEKYQEEIRSYTINRSNNNLNIYKYNFNEFEYSINQGIELR